MARSALLPFFSRFDFRLTGIELLRKSLTQGLTPHELALAIATGMACAFFPVLGAATPLCLIVGLTLRLNQPLIQAINGLTAPLYPILFFAFIRLGEWMTQSPGHSQELLGIFHPSRVNLSHLPALLGASIGHALLGWMMISALEVPLVYFAVRFLIQYCSHLQGMRRPALRGATAPLV